MISKKQQLMNVFCLIMLSQKQKKHFFYLNLTKKTLNLTIILKKLGCINYFIFADKKIKIYSQPFSKRSLRLLKNTKDQAFFINLVKINYNSYLQTISI